MIRERIAEKDFVLHDWDLERFVNNLKNITSEQIARSFGDKGMGLFASLPFGVVYNHYKSFYDTYR